MYQLLYLHFITLFWTLMRYFSSSRYVSSILSRCLCVTFRFKCHISTQDEFRCKKKLVAMKLGEHICCWRQPTLVFNDPATFPPAAFRRRRDSFLELRFIKHTQSVCSAPSGWVWNSPRSLYSSFRVRFENNYCLWKGRTQSRGTCAVWNAPLQ